MSRSRNRPRLADQAGSAHLVGCAASRGSAAERFDRRRPSVLRVTLGGALSEGPTADGDYGAHAGLMRSVPLLANVAEADVRALAALGGTRNYADGEMIFHEGDAGEALYTIVRGSVRIAVASESGRETTLATLGSGDTIGELALLDGRPRSASAIAATPTTMLVVGRDNFRRWLDEHPPAAAAMLETLSLRLRRTTETVSDLTFLELSQRIAKRLLQLLAETAPGGGRTGNQRLRITQSELAAMVGSSREAVNKRLRQFERVGIVALSRGAVTLRDVDALRRLL